MKKMRNTPNEKHQLGYIVLERAPRIQKSVSYLCEQLLYKLDCTYETKCIELHRLNVHDIMMGQLT